MKMFPTSPPEQEICIKTVLESLKETSNMSFYFPRALPVFSAADYNYLKDEKTRNYFVELEQLKHTKALKEGLN